MYNIFNRIHSEFLLCHSEQSEESSGTFMFLNEEILHSVQDDTGTKFPFSLK